MAEILKDAVSADLAEVSVINACQKLGVTPHGEGLVAGMSNWADALRIAAKFQMLACMVPDEMLSSPNAWAVITTRSGIFWSPGA